MSIGKGILFKRNAESNLEACMNIDSLGFIIDKRSTLG